MCFSVEADLAAAAVLTPFAVASLRAAPTRRHLAIAAVPAIFAAHQFIEAFVWLGFDGHVSPGVSDAAISAYLLIAQVLLPLLVPVAMALTEPVRARRRFMLACGVVGIATAARFGWIIFAHDVGAREAEHVIVYRTDLHINTWETVGYIVACCLPVLASSRRYLLAFGVANVVGLSLAAIVRYEAVTSVWCLYAALASVLILVHLRTERRAADAVRPPRSSPATG